MSARAAAAGTAILFLAALLACDTGSSRGDRDKRVIVLGFDGMDYGMVRRLIAEGRMPHFEKLSRNGLFQPLETSIPPQSPVAWSDFITGMDAGGHGIFDFVHRDPKTMLPYLSTSRVTGAARPIKLGKWQFFLSGGKTELLRRGRPFWEVLERHGIETTIIRMPANFPPSGTASRELSGMGTPDLLGNYGTFSYFTSVPFAFEGQDVSGGHVYPVTVNDGIVEADLVGPANSFLVEPEKLTAPFTVYIDPHEAAVKLVVGDQERVLKTGEWTGWLTVQFDPLPTQTLSAIARFYLKSVRPHFELYVTPLNHDPENPALPISHPADYAADLAQATGRFYTQGMPEDTSGLSEGVLSIDEFLEQAALAGEENLRQYEYVLDKFDGGLLFYYFGNLDQVSHMMWRPMDPDHPAYDPETDAPLNGVVDAIYEQLDGVVGRTLDRIDDKTTLMIMSDHGFTSWRRAFHLNAWLREHGYLVVRDPYLRDDPGMFLNVDWSRTRAYGLGLNSLYINLRDRERFGIVSADAREPLMEEIAAALLATRDPETDQPAITKVYRRETAYEDRGERDTGPDLVVGYAGGTRCSKESSLGKVGLKIFTDNTDQWSGDHCMDHEAVPGILLANRKLKRPVARLRDLAAAVMAEFGVEDNPSPGRSAPAARF